MGPEVVYVSGRTRKPGEMNGKSCNLNNCLKQIYPDGVPIPATELVCIFDADQVANIDFFCKMLPRFDAGEHPECPTISVQVALHDCCARGSPFCDLES